jgi:hypothetical protein
MGESFRFFISQCSNTGPPAVVNAPKSGLGETKNKPAVVGPPKLESNVQKKKGREIPITGPIEALCP